MMALVLVFRAMFARVRAVRCVVFDVVSVTLSPAVTRIGFGRDRDVTFLADRHDSAIARQCRIDISVGQVRQQRLGTETVVAEIAIRDVVGVRQRARPIGVRANGTGPQLQRLALQAFISGVTEPRRLASESALVRGEDARRDLRRLQRRTGFDDVAVGRRVEVGWKCDTDFGGAEVVQHLVLAGANLRRISRRRRQQLIGKDRGRARQLRGIEARERHGAGWRRSPNRLQ